MSVADTDFISPREVTRTLREIIDGGEFGYPSYPDDHREVFAAWQKKQHGWELDPDNVIIANGLLSSLVLMLDYVSAPGEGVIIFTPVYQNFFEVIAGAGRVPICCDLMWADFRGTGWTQDEIQRFLVEDAGLGVNRGDSFGASGAGFVRINCAVPECRIDEAIQQLRHACQSQNDKARR